ncbi:alpha/beta fold hydrolase [Pseudooceanicola sp.]|uniref:alpha/beta hydrolase n=1 Tax=Pseudooceanicola sp. TaxID=1914328 RepID=UPI002617271E|nr:alpha/beta fold hydrolase [Pseudooceanicola sp.]MDF1855876.1 alpha/beta fold hydrolase [Pseudooceanicola sp.]
MIDRRRFLSSGLSAGVAARLALGTAPLAGCAPTARLIQSPDIIGHVQPVFVATSRGMQADPQLAFGSDRETPPHFARYDIAVPPDRKPGEIRLPRANPDPTREFLTKSAVAFPTEAPMVRQINQAMAKLPRGERTLILFVHGYNVTFPAAVLRAAQISEDFGFKGPMLLYSWPSAGRVTEYIYDRDSTLFARNDLAALLRNVAKSKAERIVVLAHSLGSFLTMEAARTLALQRETAVLNRIRGLVLAEPDIDMSVFRQQLEPHDMQRLTVMVMGSRRDRALRVSRFIAGGHARVGSAVDIPELQRLGVIYVDVTGASDGTMADHSAFSSSPELLALISSGALAQTILSGTAGTDILVGGLRAAGNAALAIAYLPYAMSN